MNQADSLGRLPISKLLLQQAVPASIGFLIMSINGIVDTIFVGRWVGSNGIGAITVVMPIVFLIASIGMSIGIGGSSIISRAFGAQTPGKAFFAFGNQITLTIIIAATVVFTGSFYQNTILYVFGGQGDILPFAQQYFSISLIGIPFLAFSMMANNVMRAEDRPKMAMSILLISAIINIILDPIFIVYLDWGIQGAAWASSISYIASATFALWYFLLGPTGLRIGLHHLMLKWEIVSEIFSIGGVTLARQGVISLLAVILNNSLLYYGNELQVAVYGIANRMMMFINFPVIGITQGFIPIAGYNYGAKKLSRVKEVIRIAIRSGTLIAIGIFIFIMAFAKPLVRIFTTDPTLIEQSAYTLRIIFLMTPLITVQLIGSAYFQAIGKPMPALLLALTKQGFFLIPLLIILPPIFQLNGIWMAFPVADILAAGVTYLYLRREIKRTLD